MQRIDHMPDTSLHTTLQQFCLLVSPNDLGIVNDAQLLERFVVNRDEAAFATLVQRHGAMVLSVCRRVLHHCEDAEDVFQATFLLLARNGASIRNGDVVGSWLHSVAHRLAQRVLNQRMTRQIHERHVGSMKNQRTVSRNRTHELQAMLDVTLQEIPAKYRAALVLCYMEGKTQDAAAQQLGCPLATLRNWVNRGRKALQRRLQRRGFKLTIEGLVTAFVAANAAASVPTRLFVPTMQAALAIAEGKETSGIITASVASLLAEGIQGLFAAKAKMVALLCLLSTLVMSGAVALARQHSNRVELQANEEAQIGFVLAKAEQEKKTGEPRRALADRYGDPLPTGALARFGTVRFRHDGMIRCTAISPDGHLIAAGGLNSIQIFNAETGQTLHHINGTSNTVQALAFTPDNKQLASFDRNMMVRFTDTDTGKTVKDFKLLQNARPGSGSTNSFLAFCPDGKAFILKDGSEAVVRLMDSTNGQEIRSFRSDGYLYGVALSPDGNLLSTLAQNGLVRIWEVATGRERQVLKIESQARGGLAFAPDSKTLAGGDGGSISLWDVATGRVLKTLNGRIAETTIRNANGNSRVIRDFSPGAITSLDYSSDGKRLVASHGATVIILDLTTGQQAKPVSHASARTVHFLPDGKTVLLDKGDLHMNTLLFHDTITGERCRTFDGHQNRIQALAYAPQGQYVATAEDDMIAPIRVWDARSGCAVAQIGERMRDTAKALSFNPTEEHLAAGHGKKVVVWDLKTGQEVRTIPAHDTGHIALLYSADGTKLASGGTDGSVRVWDMVQHKELQNFRVAEQTVWALVFSADLRLAASAQRGGDHVQLWDLTSGQKWKDLKLGRHGGFRLAFSPDGRSLLETDGSSNLYLWELSSGEQRRRIHLPKFPFTVAFSSNGRLIVAGEATESDRDRVDSRVPIHVIDLASNRLVSTFRGHLGNVVELQFSADGRTMVSASADSTALLWDVEAASTHAAATALAAEQRTAYWSELAGNAQQAYDAMWKLAEDKEFAEFVREKLRPTTSVDVHQFARLLAELDSDEFVVRSRAREQLMHIGVAVETELRAALRGRLSVEVRRVVEELLRTLERDQLRQQRAVELLELIDTAASRQLLLKLADGTLEARLTQEAIASLERLANKNAVKK